MSEMNDYAPDGDSPENKSSGDRNLILAVGEHIRQYVGEGLVFHEIMSPLVHVDIFTVPASAARPFHTLVTCGMSEKPMNTPPGKDRFRHAELVIHLPADWPLNQEAFKDERNYWPLRLLKKTARFPHEHHTWLGFMHTVANGDPPVPYASNTGFCGTVVLFPTVLPESFHKLSFGDNVIHFYVLVPLYLEELELKLAKGMDALAERMDEFEVSDVLDVKRPRIVPQKK